MATLRKRGDVYYVDWREGGKRHRRSLGKIPEKAALKQQALIEAQILTRGSSDAAKSIPRFSEYAADYTDWYAFEYPASWKRVEAIIRLHLMPVLEHTQLHQIDARKMEQWKVRRRQQGAKGATINKELTCLKAMLNRAVEWDVLEKSPITHVKAVKVLDSKMPHFYTREELQQIYAVDPGHRYLWQLYASTGLRCTEGLQLRWAECAEDRIHVISTEQARTKSGKHRVVPLAPSARAALDALREDADTSEFVIPRVNSKSLSRAFRKAVNRAELEGSLHCLRHTFCSHLVMGGIPLTTVKELAGHSTIKVTEKYAHLTQGHLEEAVQGLTL